MLKTRMWRFSLSKTNIFLLMPLKMTHRGGPSSSPFEIIFPFLPNLQLKVALIGSGDFLLTVMISGELFLLFIIVGGSGAIFFGGHVRFMSGCLGFVGGFGADRLISYLESLMLGNNDIVLLAIQLDCTRFPSWSERLCRLTGFGLVTRLSGTGAFMIGIFGLSSRLRLGDGFGGSFGGPVAVFTVVITFAEIFSFKTSLSAECKEKIRVSTERCQICCNITLTAPSWGIFSTGNSDLSPTL